MTFKLITTHIQGIYANKLNVPCSNAYIIAEDTDYLGTHKGQQAKYQLDKFGAYNFVLREGYSNIYYLENNDSNMIKLGLVRINESDFKKVYTIEELLNK